MNKGIEENIINVLTRFDREAREERANPKGLEEIIKRGLAMSKLLLKIKKDFGEHAMAKLYKEASEKAGHAIGPIENEILEDMVKLGLEISHIQSLRDFYEEQPIEDGTELRFKKLSIDAITPQRGSRNAAGFDLFSTKRLEIHPHSTAIIGTDIAVKLPRGTYGRIAPRSGLAINNFIDVGAGVVDYDYRGDIRVVLFNHHSQSFIVDKGDRIAQFIIQKICTPRLVEVEFIGEIQIIGENERGANGFGSTGKRGIKEF